MAARTFQLTTAVLATFFIASAGTGQTPSRPEVALNHVYVVLDSATLAAIEASAFLANEFSHHRKATNRTADGRSWTGVYLFGERTYVEFFPPGVNGGVGFSGLALSVEQLGAIDSVEARLSAKLGVPVRRRLIEGSFEGRAYPWFHSVSAEHPRGDSLWQVHSWVLENHPEFYRVVQRDTTGPTDDISRKRYLRRRYQPERMVREIVGVSLALNPTIGEQLRAELVALGWTVESDTVRGSFRALGPEAVILVVPIMPGDPYGIREIRFALNRGPAAAQIHELGNSRLEVCATHARWTLGAAPSSRLPVSPREPCR